ncbi:hypothetical protein [Stenotrophobium rhamnosiphilum]|uniref:Lipoprotein n=1 Tax=Stenotrophobium rhamnosiphilum TaxID=2029166 RepID=A0A2T5MB41_9GAMM|nr:hypothetical protein [Stenotrophobium rhamnosiphilum]PTU28225.1 hypothetical protein CJD38_17905 [Stenotrophobium rhamnosiphilum]
MKYLLSSTLTAVLALTLVACDRDAAYDPLALATAQGKTINNPFAVVPSQCYTKTDGVSNPCWTCHTDKNGSNALNDAHLQEEYAFSKVGMNNPWTNLFKDRSAVIASISDTDALTWVRQDNYRPLRKALRRRGNYGGWVPDFDFARGFDADGFAKDGSHWRAFRYKPFPGTFWPTNGSTDDVMIRLPRFFRANVAGVENREIYKANLAILEASLGVGANVPDSKILRRIEPIDEAAVGADINGDGKIEGRVDVMRGLPLRYVGGAAGIGVVRHFYPIGTEFLHSVRYIDPDAPSLLSTRFKELRYSVKIHWVGPDELTENYAEERNEPADTPPIFYGSAVTGVISPFGWSLQGFIEDAQGRLRLQTREEHQFCMGCHSGLGVTVDQSFGFPRKVPGSPGWGHQSLDNIPDVPQAGHVDPETLVYFRRAHGGDEFRANQEVLERYFPAGKLDEAKVRAAKDMRELITPSRERALALNKAYMALVREQDFVHGRDAVAQPATNVHTQIKNGDTKLKKNGAVYKDGTLWLEWPAPATPTAE